MGIPDAMTALEESRRIHKPRKQPKAYKAALNAVIASISRAVAAKMTSTLKPDQSRLYASIPRTLNPDYNPNVLSYHIREHDRRNAGVRGPGLTEDEIRVVVGIHNAALASRTAE